MQRYTLSIKRVKRQQGQQNNTPCRGGVGVGDDPNPDNNKTEGDNNDGDQPRYQEYFEQDDFFSLTLGKMAINYGTKAGKATR